MRVRQFGKTGMEGSVVGYGTVSLLTPPRSAEASAVRILQQVLAAGVTFLGTADTYCPGPEELHCGERIIRRALEAPSARASRVWVATKGGAVRTRRGWE